jgi:para-nitrobenzyl esterase
MKERQNRKFGLSLAAPEIWIAASEAEATMKTKGNFFRLALGGALMIAVSLNIACGGGSGAAPPPNLAIATASLPDGTIGASYSQTIQASGGVAPFIWSVSTGALPHNVALGASSNNLETISGIPDQVQASVAFTIEVTDVKGQSAKQSYAVNIKASPTVAQTQSGALQGVVEGDLLVFRGVPFAAPPLGNLRWRPPAPPPMWQGVRDASMFGNVCPQVNFNGQLVGDEDCLTLNIFRAATPPNTAQPVMVFIHGGGNFRGDGQSPPFDMPPLAAHGAIVVTAEYRVGILGFLPIPLLTAEGGGSSGNYGLLDMIAVLAWVQQNIAAFGGDPKHVMLFGQSAGSYDIQMLLAAPAAQGLFSVAGMESNVIPKGQLLPFAIAETRGEPFVAAVGCDTAADILHCLRAVPVATILNLGRQFFWGPGVGSPFLPVDPFIVLQQNGSPVPLLIGSTREESTNFGDNPNAPLDATGYATAIHNSFDPFGAGVANQVLTLYPAAAYDTPEYALIAVDSDFQMTCEVRTVARVAAGANRKPVWRYFYTHRFENDASLNAMRAFHTAELYFVFGNFSQISPAFANANNYQPTPAEVTFTSDMMGYWTRFAATGNPNGAGAVPWPPYDPNTDAMLQLDDTFMPINGYHNPQCDYLVTLPQP